MQPAYASQPEKGLWRCLGVQDCIRHPSRSTSQQPLQLLEPPRVFMLPIKPSVQSTVLSHRPLKLCNKLLRKIRFLLQGLFSSTKDLEMTLILYIYFSPVLFKSPFLKVCWLMMWLLECFSPPEDKVQHFQKCFIKKPTNTTTVIP